MVLGQEHVPQPKFSGALLQTVNDGGVAFPALLADANLRCVGSICRDAFLFYETLDLYMALASMLFFSREG